MFIFIWYVLHYTYNLTVYNFVEDTFYKSFFLSTVYLKKNISKMIKCIIELINLHDLSIL